jgi:hypothetical protein
MICPDCARLSGQPYYCSTCDGRGYLDDHDPVVDPATQTFDPEKVRALLALIDQAYDSETRNRVTQLAQAVRDSERK